MRWGGHCENTSNVDIFIHTAAKLTLKLWWALSFSPSLSLPPFLSCFCSILDRQVPPHTHTFHPRPYLGSCTHVSKMCLSIPPPLCMRAACLHRNDFSLYCNPSRLGSLCDCLSKLVPQKNYPPTPTRLMRCHWTLLLFCLSPPCRPQTWKTVCTRDTLALQIRHSLSPLAHRLQNALCPHGTNTVSIARSLHTLQQK